jgi:transposase
MHDRPATAPDYQLFVGVDVAAASVTCCWMTPDGAPTRPVVIAQTPAGHADLRRRLLATGLPPAAILVVLEATGPYWVAPATALAAAGFAVSVVNPAQAHHFAKALLKRGKTDALDAQTLAQLAALLRPAPWTPPPAVYHELQQRLAQRDALLRLRTQIGNQLHALTQGPVVVASVRARMEALLEALAGQLAEVDGELEAAIGQDAAWAAAFERLRSIPGVGPVTALWLLVATLNFSACDGPTAAAAYAGLAPRPRESGTSVRGRPRIGKAGHARLRTALYLATLSACRHNPVIRPFYTRLRAAGKPMKVARCAAARKLLHLAWAVATTGRAFDPAGRAPHPVAAAAD